MADEVRRRSGAAAPAGERPRREPTVSERRIARRLADKDDEAATLILAEYGSTLRGYLRHVLARDPSLAEDVLQQVLLQAWQTGSSFDPGRGPLLHWLMMIARSRAYDALRRRLPEPRDPDATVRSLDQEAQQDDPADRLVAHWELHHLLSTLPPGTAALLRMRFELGLSQSEISERTGIPLGTVKGRMAGGLERLREEMSPKR